MKTTRLLTTSDVAEMLQLKTDTIYTLIGKGEMPAVKLGNQWRYDEDKLLAWIDEKSINKSSTESADRKSAR